MRDPCRYEYEDQQLCWQDESHPIHRRNLSGGDGFTWFFAAGNHLFRGRAFGATVLTPAGRRPIFRTPAREAA